MAVARPQDPVHGRVREGLGELLLGEGGMVDDIEGIADCPFLSATALPDQRYSYKVTVSVVAYHISGGNTCLQT